MASPNPRIRQLSGSHATAIRLGRPDPDLAAQLATERIADYVERVVASAPPLSKAQRDRLALLLRGDLA